MSYKFDIKTQQYIESDDSVYSSTYLPNEQSDETSGNAFSVSDALLLTKTALQSIQLKIIGEISEMSNKSGYKAVYFTIKDSKSALPCLMWKNKFLAADIDIKVGDKVEISGRFSLYTAKGRMNFEVNSISYAGEGQLRVKVAQLAKKLEKEGLTDASRKRAISQFPQRVGVVTSPRGAVIHDVIRTVKRRMPLIEIVFAGCNVEGQQAPKKIIEALSCLEKSNVDVIILCRGGGSFEDLMPFNDEQLVYKISELNVPVVTGIGHEPDTTIADLVSDFRASTPTAAAEKVSFDSVELVARYSQKLDNIKRSTINRLNTTKEYLQSIASRPIFTDLNQLYASEFLNLDYLSDKLASIMKQNLESYQNSVSLAAAKLHDKSPLVVISRGYCVAKDLNNNIVKKVDDVCLDQSINLVVSDGSIGCVVKNLEKS